MDNDQSNNKKTISSYM